MKHIVFGFPRYVFFCRRGAEEQSKDLRTIEQLEVCCSFFVFDLGKIRIIQGKVEEEA